MGCHGYAQTIFNIKVDFTSPLYTIAQYVNEITTFMFIYKYYYTSTFTTMFVHSSYQQVHKSSRNIFFLVLVVFSSSKNYIFKACVYYCIFITIDKYFKQLITYGGRYACSIMICSFLFFIYYFFS